MTTVTDHETATDADAPIGSRRGPSLGTLAQRYSLLVLWVAMGAVFFLLADVPLSNFLQGIFARQTPLVFLGMAVVLTMAVGEFDLSFPSIYALSGASVSSLVILHCWSFPMAAVAAVGLALLFGAANALAGNVFQGQRLLAAEQHMGVVFDDQHTKVVVHIGSA
jgi:ribose transport system permease protein